MKNIEEAAI